MVLGAASTNSLASFRPRPDDFAHNLDNLDLLSAGVNQNDVELGLLFSRSGSGSARSSGSGNGSGSGYAEFGFQRLNQIHELDNAHALNGIDKFFMSHENDLQ